MTELRSAPTSTAAGRVLGHLVGVLVNVVMLLAIHVWPGWDALPFLTGETPQVLGIIDASLVAGIVVHLLQLPGRPGWLNPAGLVVTSAFGVATSLRVLQVFPFDLSHGWELVVRVLLVIGVVGAAIGVLAALVSLVRMRRAERLR